MLAEDIAREASVSEIRNDLLRQLPTGTIYFPALTLQGTLAWDHGMAGYVFVGDTAEAYFHRLQRSRFVDRLVQTPTRDAIERLTPAQMAEMRRAARAPALRVGTKVRILAGDYRNLSGRVAKIDTAAGYISVAIALHSRSLVVVVSPHDLERVC